MSELNINDPTRAHGDGWAMCLKCHRTWAVRDGERPEQCCGRMAAIYDRAYWEFVQSLDDD